MNRIGFASVATLIASSFLVNLAQADLVYTLKNSPADQDGATLVGTITTNGTVDDVDPLGARLFESDIISWEYTISKPGFDAFSVNSGMTGNFIELPSGTWANSQRILISDSTRFQFGVDLGNSQQTSISYRSAGAPRNYFANLAGNESPRGWNTDSPAGFSSSSGWVIATAVPEPSSLIILGAGMLGLISFRRRSSVI